MKTETHAPKKTKFNIGVFDFETDPFSFGAIIAPFCVGAINARGNYFEHWGCDSARAFVEYLRSETTPHIFYAHNGGRFDFLFLVEWLNAGDIQLINGRIVSCRIGIHELRDSFAIFPMALKNANKKDDIDYEKMRKDRRDAHRAEILDYLKSDCEYLLGLMKTYVSQATTQRSKEIPKTAASAAYKQLEKTCPQPSSRKPKDPEEVTKWQTRERAHDDYFRAFYSGGRVEPFKKGIITGDFKLFDVNSMYPAVMKSFQFPRGKTYITLSAGEFKLTPEFWIRGFPNAMFYLTFEGECEEIRAFDERGKPHFGKSQGVFRLVSHEFRAGMELGVIKVTRLIEVKIPSEVQNFAPHVDRFYGLRKSEGNADKTLDTFFKLCLNAPYGKFSYDYRNYKRQVFDNGNLPEDFNYEEWREADEYVDENGMPLYRILEADNNSESYYDVAIGAAITAAARSVLMRAKRLAVNPLYCDTDSLLCECLPDDMIGPELGKWKLELSGITTAAIAGRKLYGLFDDSGKMVKCATKGVRLTPSQILWVAQDPDHEAVYFRDAPSMRIGKQTRYITRKVRQT